MEVSNWSPCHVVAPPRTRALRKCHRSVRSRTEKMCCKYQQWENGPWWREAGHYQATTRACSRRLMCPQSDPEESRSPRPPLRSSVVWASTWEDKTAFQPGTRASSVPYVVLVFFLGWLEDDFLVPLWKCKLIL